MKIFFKTNLSLDDLASAIRRALNIPPTNPSQIIQAREGENIGGGRYYFFEILGLELYLIQNAGDVAVGRQSEFQFYLYAQGRAGIHEDLDFLISYVVQFLKEKGFDVEIDEIED